MAKAKRKAEFPVRPLDDRAIIKVDAEEREKVTPGGIVLPDVARNQAPSEFATVMAVGPGRPWPERIHAIDPVTDPLAGVSCPDARPTGPRFPMSVRVGDRVIVGRFAGSAMVIDHEEYTIIREADILAIVPAES